MSKTRINQDGVSGHWNARLERVAEGSSEFNGPLSASVYLDAGDGSNSSGHPPCRAVLALSALAG
jgi:hypothetical protein